MRLIRQFVIGFLIIFISQNLAITVWAKDGPINVNGKQLESSFKFKKGIKYLPIEQTCSALGMSAKRDSDKWTIKGTYRGDIHATVRKSGFIERDKIVFAPVNFWTKELGLEICEKDNTVFVLNCIKEVKKLPDGLLITTSAPLKIKSLKLDNPPRSVFDVSNLSMGTDEPEVQYPFENLPFSAVRLGQFEKFPHTGRFVVDHASNPSFQPIQSIHGPANNILWIGRKAYEEKSDVESAKAGPQKESTPSIKIDSDGSVLLSGVNYDKANIFYLWDSKPYKIYCDINNCILANTKEQEFPGKGRIIKVRLAQNTQDKENIARLVIELTEPIMMEITESKGDYIKISPVIRNLKKGLKVLIDIGHGGADAGTQAFAKEMGGLSADEKDMNLRLGLMLGKYLEGIGMQVFYTRTTDIFIDLNSRRDMANRLGVDLLVSVHCNSTPTKPCYYVSGPEIYYSSSRDKKLAEAVWRHMSQMMGIPGRGYLLGKYHVIMNNSMPSILIETAFFNNPNDLAKLLNTTSGFCEAAMSGVANGISEIFGLPMVHQLQSSGAIAADGKALQNEKEVQAKDKYKMLAFDYNPFELPSRETRDKTTDGKVKKEEAKKEKAEPQKFAPPDQKKKMWEEKILLEDLESDASENKISPKEKESSESSIIIIDEPKEEILISDDEEITDDKSENGENQKKKELKKRRRNIFKLD